MSKKTFSIPDIGGADGVEVIEISVAVGDSVKAEQSLLVLESDKASMEVPSPEAGTVAEILVSEGDSVSEGDDYIVIETASDDSDEASSENDNAEENAGGDESKSKDTAAKGDENDAAGDPDPHVDEDDADEAGETTEQASESVAVVVPDIGTDGSVEVIEILVAAGDSINDGDSIVVLESDKASMEVPSSTSGTIESITVKEGDSVKQGDELLKLATTSTKGNGKPKQSKAEDKGSSDAADKGKKPSDAAEQSSGAEAAKPESNAPSKETAKPSKSASIKGRPGGDDYYAGPAVRKLARELGVDIGDVKGTGPKSRVQKIDLENYVKSVVESHKNGGGGIGVSPIPSVDFSEFGDIDEQKLTRMDKLTAENMHRSWVNLPHVSHFDDADVTGLEDFRSSMKAEAQQRGVKVTPLPFLLKACAHTLLQHERFNASLHSDGEHIVYKKYVHIGIAVDTPAGLMVPVVRDVDKKGIWELAEETAELAELAKNRKLKPEQMRGGCFTISSLGGIGGNGFTPIINAPELAILGVSRLATKPVWNGTDFEPRKLLPLTLSYDHRAINGAHAGQFMATLTSTLADIRKLIM